MTLSPNRRQLLTRLASLAAGVSLPRLGGSVAHGQSAFGLLMAEPGTGPTLVQIVLIDKVQAALFQKVDGTVPAGADGQGGLAQQESSFRGMGLCNLFGNGLVELPDSTALVLNNTWESGTAGHSLDGARLGANVGSVNYAFESISGSTGLLGPIGFSVASDANNSADAFRDDQGRPMQSYTNVGELRRTVEDAIKPLQVFAAHKQLIGRLDGLVVKDAAIRSRLDALIETAAAVTPELAAAEGLTDPVDAQVQAVLALSKAGLARNFMIAIPWDDTNGGGTLATAGGEFNIDPLSATPRLAAALVKLHKAIPDLYCVSTSDGGRDLANNDTSAGFAFMTGPATSLKNGAIGGRFTSTEQLGRTFGDAAISDGQRRPSTPADWYATVLKAMGLKVESPYVLEALV